MSNLPPMREDRPSVDPDTRFRIRGPSYNKHGMATWCLHGVTKDGFTGKQIGPTFLSFDEAVEYAKDLMKGKKIVWFGNSKFEPRKL